MVFVKVRETYDLCTVKDKMTIIGIHTPKTDIIKRNFPGLLMQCRAYRPASCDVKIACASVLPLDPLGIGTSTGDVAPEDVFNPILYKACSNFGMSQIEARIQYLTTSPSVGGSDVAGSSAVVDVDSVTTATDEFPIYYGLLSNAHDWKHANPQSGLQMIGLKPLVWEGLYNFGDNISHISSNNMYAPANDGTQTSVQPVMIKGNAKPMPFINTTGYTGGGSGATFAGWSSSDIPNPPYNCEKDVPYIKVLCGCIIIPPSRLHQLFYRMVVEWTLEFSSIRPLSEITDWTGLAQFGNSTHYQNYSYEATKEALTGSSDTIMDSDTCMVSTNVDIKKVM